MKPRIRRTLSRLRGGGARQRAMSVLVVTLVASSAVVGALGPALGPASPTGDAEAVNLISDSEKNALAAGYYDAFPMGDLFSNPVPEPTISDTESNETRNNIIASLETQRQNNEILLDTYGNYLQDTEQPGTLIGMNTYIRKLNNGSAEAESRQAAKQAVADYYATKQVQLNKQWAVTVENLKTAKQKAENDTGITADGTGESFFYLEGSSTDGGTTDGTIQGVTFGNLDNTRQITLVNGTTVDVAAPKITAHVSFGSSPYDYSGSLDPYRNFTYTTVQDGNIDPSTQRTITVDSLKTKSTPSVSGARLFYRLDWDVHQRIDNQQDNLDQRMDNIVNETYSKYQQGEINESDLISPLQLTRSYSPDTDGEYGTFTLATLSSMGYSSPTNLGSTKTMNVSVTGPDGTTDLQGILLSDGLPSSGDFTVGTTYNTSNLDGIQYVQTDSGLVDIGETYSGNRSGASFTVTDVVGSDGSALNQTSIGYTNPSYDSTNISEYKETMEELRTLQAQIDARQANLSSGGSGGGGLNGIDFGFSGLDDLLGFGVSGTVWIIALAGGALLILTRN